MRVSVVIPLFNKAPYVTRCLSSVAAQTYRDFEVIVVDDGSTDDSLAVANCFANSLLAHEIPIRIHSQPNGGPGSARNFGVSFAQGEILAFLDADDEWAPDYLNANLEAWDLTASENPDVAVAAVVSGYIDYPSGQDREAMWRGRGLVEGVFRASPDTRPELFAQILAYHACGNTMVRADLFRELGGFFARDRCVFGEDSWLWARVLLTHAVLIRFQPLTCIHREASELSGNYRRARPIEPFLLDPGPLKAVCPPPLARLLKGLLAFRALKTACVLGYFGQWRQASALRRRFVKLSYFRLPYFWPALVCSTPLGGFLGGLWRWSQPRAGRRSRLSF